MNLAAASARRSNLDLATALAEARAAFVAANPGSGARFEAAARVMPGGNTRTVLFYEPFPLCIARGEGAKLWDVDGHAYLDFLGEFTAGIWPQHLKFLRLIAPFAPRLRT